MVTIEHCRRKLGPGATFYCEHFHAAAGDHVALWGPSGCGKSTMLNLVSGLLRPDSGKVIVDGTELQDLSEGKLDYFRGDRLGFVFQTFNLLSPFTALQNVMLSMRFSDKVPAGEWKSRSTMLLERVGLGHRLNSKPRTMSVGEQQRVAIARALANHQRIIVADEPTGSLDPKNAAEVMELFLEICQEEKVTMLLVTHDKELAARLPIQFECKGLVTEGEQ
jgi:ABC-type lipoprotein export system ATPase subunit